MEKEEAAGILLDIGAVGINPANPFKYLSGLLSPIYTNCRILTYFPRERRLIINGLMEQIKSNGIAEIDVVVGTASSGISLATYVSNRLKLPMAYVRTTAKEHGKGGQIEGILKKGSKALLVTDIISTGEDIPASVRAIKDAGGEVVFCVAIMNNNLGLIETLLRKEQVRFDSLTDLETLVNVAFVKKKISPQERTVILDWMKDPDGWDKTRRKKIDERMEENKKKIAGILLKINAVTLNTKKPYRYVSGMLSPIYTDNRLLMSYPNKWESVIDSFADIIVDKIGVQNVDVIAGTATAGISHAAYLAEKLGLPMVYIKSEKDESGTKRFMVEGRLKKGDRVIVLEDLISTGGSSLSAVRAVKDAGGKVDHCLAIFTYEMEKAETGFENEKVELTTLTNISTLIDVASKQGYIKPEEKTKVIEWTKDTAGWGKKMGFE